jgi:hypothetical protein
MSGGRLNKNKPSYQKEYRQKVYAFKDKSPEVRHWLIVARLNQEELERFLFRCERKNVKPATMVRLLINAFSGVKRKGK